MLASKKIFAPVRTVSDEVNRSQNVNVYEFREETAGINLRANSHGFLVSANKNAHVPCEKLRHVKSDIEESQDTTHQRGLQ